jgi:mRNA-degrading endonuclease RelE of RelBE toxin-antitoxin system
MPFRILYSESSSKIIRRLHPSLKPLFRQKIEALPDNPFLGKALERELTGYYSLKSKKYRVIYRLNHSGKIIQIHYLGYRKDIYDIFRQLLEEKEERSLSKEKAVKEMAGWLSPQEAEELDQAISVFGRKKRRSK